MPTDEAHIEIYMASSAAYEALIDPHLLKEQEVDIEYVSVARILYYLGYISPVKEIHDILVSVSVTADILDQVRIVRPLLAVHINEGLSASQL